MKTKFLKKIILVITLAFIQFPIFFSTNLSAQEDKRSELKSSVAGYIFEKIVQNEDFQVRSNNYFNFILKLQENEIFVSLYELSKNYFQKTEDRILILGVFADCEKVLEELRLEKPVGNLKTFRSLLYQVFYNVLPMQSDNDLEKISALFPECIPHYLGSDWNHFYMHAFLAFEIQQNKSLGFPLPKTLAFWASVSTGLSYEIISTTMFNRKINENGDETWERGGFGEIKYDDDVICEEAYRDLKMDAAGTVWSLGLLR
ncbi:MAG: hypothetical protein ABIA04_14350 [Pseudomonadota bacterium]